MSKLVIGICDDKAEVIAILKDIVNNVMNEIYEKE